MPRRAARFYVLNKHGDPLRGDGTFGWPYKEKYQPGRPGALYFNRIEKAIKAAKKFGGKVMKRDAVQSHYGYWHGSDSFSPLSRTTKRVSFMKNPRGRSLQVWDRHQLKIARDTLKMSDAGARVMGGMTKEEARKVILRLTGRKAKGNPRKRRYSRRNRKIARRARRNCGCKGKR